MLVTEDIRNDVHSLTHVRCYDHRAAGHDGTSLYLETSNGITVSNRITLDGSTLNGMNRYIEYLNEFYDNGQHAVVPPTCEYCGANIRDHSNPLTDALHAEIYNFRHQDNLQEVRLCKECAKVVDEAFLIAVIKKRPPAAGNG